MKSARSWAQAPELVVKGNGFHSEGFERGDRAYQIRLEGAEGDGPFECEVRGSADSPLVNVALVVQDWGPSGAKLQIDGQPVPRGNQFRYGYRHELEGSTLLV